MPILRNPEWTYATNSKTVNSSTAPHRPRIDRRAADALVGLAAGFTADGIVSTNEAIFLKQWLENNLAHLNDPVINLLYSRLASMLQDDALDPDESLELLNILRGFSGVSIEKPKDGIAVAFAQTDLPFNSPAPAPDLVWDGRLFVFTGVMAFGPRKDCQALVEERGGLIVGGVSKKVHYLVVGSVGQFYQVQGMRVGFGRSGRRRRSMLPMSWNPFRRG